MELSEFPDQSSIADSGTSDSKPSEKCQATSDRDRQRKKSLALILEPKRKTSMSGPFLQPNSAPSKESDKELPSERLAKSPPPPERKRKKSVIKVGGNITRKLSNAVLTKAVMPNHPPTISEEAGKDNCSNTAVTFFICTPVPLSCI